MAYPLPWANALTAQLGSLISARTLIGKAMSLRKLAAPACACSALILGSVLMVHASKSNHSTRHFTNPVKLAQQACNPQTQTCCFNPDGTPVPPGTKRGPYTCLPNGTWG